MNFDFEAIGTQWSIDLPNETSVSAARLLDKIVAREEQFDQDYSRFREDSLVAQISRSAGTYQLPSDAKPLLDFYQKLYQLSNGLFTPIIGNALEQAGYDRHYSLKPGALTPLPDWGSVLDYEFPTLKTAAPVTLDFGAAGKGYLIDLIAGLLKAEKITEFTIDASGDILHYGSELAIGLEDPADATQAIGIAKIAQGSIAGSSGSRRKWKNFHHIINPVTLKSVQNVIAVWVTAEQAMVADGLATALYLQPQPKQFQNDFQFETLILFEDRTIKQTKGFPAELFYEIH